MARVRHYGVTIVRLPEADNAREVVNRCRDSSIWRTAARNRKLLFGLRANRASNPRRYSRGGTERRATRAPAP